MSCLLDCFAFCCCDILCCECNKFVFPAPRQSQFAKYEDKADGLKLEYKSFNSQGRNVPYLQISDTVSRQSKKCFIYFHGNGEDIGLLSYFLQPIFQAIKITFYAIEYPTYGTYKNTCKALISNKIKEDSLNFYEFVKAETKRRNQDIYIMGRSIGSGGATYLASNKQSPILILISPFDTIKKVAKDFFGCLSIILKQHFDNQSQIVRFNGKLLIIHGENDEVIRVTHAKHLTQIYQQHNSYKNKAVKCYQQQMTHNRFILKEDIIAPISKFLSECK